MLTHLEWSKAIQSFYSTLNIIYSNEVGCLGMIYKHKGIKCILNLSTAIMVGAMLIIGVQASEAKPIFKDTVISSYYYDSICNLYFKGIVNGYSESLFGPNDNVSKTQAILMLNRLSGRSNEIITNSDDWESPVIDWAIKNGFETSNNISGPATRYDVARYIVQILDIPTDIPGIQENIFKDTNNMYSNILFALNIASGVYDSAGNRLYNGDKSISRAEFCVMLDRATDTNYIDLDSLGIKDSRIKAIPEKSVLPSKYEQESDFIQMWNYMLDNYLTELTISLGNKTFNNLDEVKAECRTYTQCVYKALEARPLYEGYYSQFNTKIAYSNMPDGRVGNIKLTFSIELKNNITSKEYRRRVEMTKLATQDAIINMYNTGIVNNSMSDKEKAYEYCKFLADKLDYDYSYSSRTGYDSLVTKKAVCQGYSSLYAYMLQLEGMDTRTITGESRDGLHEWIEVKVGNQLVYIDPTWFDSGEQNVYKDQWFWTTREYMELADNWRIFNA